VLLAEKYLPEGHRVHLLLPLLLLHLVPVQHRWAVVEPALL
jgi:hypothetical protein